mgnify:CR=1 FL=1
MTRSGRLVWGVLVIFFWAAAFFIGSCIPSVGALRCVAVSPCARTDLADPSSPSRPQRRRRLGVHLLVLVHAPAALRPRAVHAHRRHDGRRAVHDAGRRAEAQGHVEVVRASARLLRLFLSNAGLTTRYTVSLAPCDHLRRLEAHRHQVRRPLPTLLFRSALTPSSLSQGRPLRLLPRCARDAGPGPLGLGHDARPGVQERRGDEPRMREPRLGLAPFLTFPGSRGRTKGRFCRSARRLKCTMRAVTPTCPARSPCSATRRRRARARRHSAPSRSRRPGGTRSCWRARRRPCRSGRSGRRSWCRSCERRRARSQLGEQGERERRGRGSERRTSR